VAQEALDAGSVIGHERSKAHALIGVTQALAQVKKMEAASRVAHEALAAARAIDYAEGGVSIVRTIARETFRAEALIEVAQTLGRRRWSPRKPSAVSDPKRRCSAM
jgi:hypothetical protein